MSFVCYSQLLAICKSTPATIVIVCSVVVLEQICFGEEGLEGLSLFALQLLRLDLTADGLHAFFNLVHQGQQVFFNLRLDLLLLSKSILVEVFSCNLLNPVSDRIEDFNDVCLLVLRLVVFPCISILGVDFVNHGEQLFLAIIPDIGCHHCYDLVLSSFSHFPDQLSLHKEVLDAKPDIGDVILPRHHQVKSVQLMSFDSLLLTEVASCSTCFTST